MNVLFCRERCGRLRDCAPTVARVALGDFDRKWLRRTAAAYVTFGLVIVVHFVGLVTGTRPIYLATAVLGPVLCLILLACMVMLLRTRTRKSP